MKNKIMLWVLVVVVVGALIFITVNKGNKEESMNDDAKSTVQQLEGVKVTVLQEGTGEAAMAGDTVSMNYTGTFTDGTPFDSNVLPEFGHPQPFVFNLGSGQVIKGWDTGIVGMKVGEKRKLEIAPESAYGEAGAGGVIPPNATLMFEVELLSISK